MAAGPTQLGARFDPGAIECFRFLERSLDADGRVRLRYALDDTVSFEEQFELPLAAPLSDAEARRVDGLLALLHWVAGVSYYKTALPGAVSFAGPAPGPAARALLQALYSRGLGELAYRNRLAGLPDPGLATSAVAPAAPPSHDPHRVLVPIGGGKDSIVALELVRRSGAELALFSVGDATPIARTAEVAGLEHLLARRHLDAKLGSLNRAGAINGHVPVTAIVACVAVLVAALRSFDTVAMANERSASSGNLVWNGVEVNHQFSKSLEAERLLRAAVAEASDRVQLFSVLRGASELAIARAFARLPRYHGAFTSCNAVFRSDPALRQESWCCECPKCRFVFLVLAPFSEPEQMRTIFGRDLLDEEDQLEGFALLMAAGGHKPFECVGEEQESIAAARLLAEDPRWRTHRVVARLSEEVLPALAAPANAAEEVLALSDEHFLPESLLADADALLGA